MKPLVSVAQHEQVAVAALEGEIDLSCTPTLGRAIFQQMSTDAVGIVLDMAGVRYIDSSGVRMLFDMARQLAEGRRTMALSAPADSPLRRLFEVTNIAQAVPLFDSVERAAGALRKQAAEVADSP